MVHSSVATWRRSRILAVCGVVFALTSLYACSDSDPPTQPPPPPTLTITCPARAEVDSPSGDPVLVTMAPPTVSGGVAPVSTSCSPQPGALFAGGTTTVTCTATDSRGTTAACTTSVFVRLPPRVIASGRFLAFGDSITAGKFSPPGTSLVESEFAYTIYLETSLRTRYRFQSPVVINEGISGEVAHIGGVTRFRSVLLATRPDVLLLMEGSNDLVQGASGIDAAIDALRIMVREAKSQAVRVALATIPPQRIGAPRPDGVPELVPVFNERVRTLAVAEQVVLVDVYQAMIGNVATLIGVDGLHPTPAGFQVIAATFATAIQTNFEQPHPAITLR